jgi:hypothetical protein
MRAHATAALISLCLAVTAIVWASSWKGQKPAARSVQWLDAVDKALFQRGLIHRHDVVVQVNNVEVARGFSRMDCDGLLLVTQLPNTAQGWQHVAPTVEFSRYAIRYVYDGEVYDAVPILPRLRHWLLGTLPGSFEPRGLVTGLAEVGHCHLLSRALPVIMATRAIEQQRGATSL